MAKIKVKRIYEPPSRGDGYRILVDRLWPRGLTKEEASIDQWVKEIAPTTELRKWFDHDPDKFPEFKQRYTRELQSNESVEVVLAAVRSFPTVTLLFGAKDEAYNQAVVLRNFLEQELRSSSDVN